MAYLRWSYSNWYVYWDCAGYVQIWHVDGGGGRYNFNSDIDEFIKNEFNNVSEDFITIRKNSHSMDQTKYIVLCQMWYKLHEKSTQAK